MGGLGISENLHILGDNVIHNTTLSTNTATGALVVKGGVGIQENAQIGGSITGKNLFVSSGKTIVKGGFFNRTSFMSQEIDTS